MNIDKPLKIEKEVANMTDEEMAVNWIAKYVGQSVEVIKNIQLKCYRNLKDAYLAGLKTCKPQWHDLRKDPNDLPKEDCEVITLHENGNKNILKWKNGNWTNAIVIPVIKWYKIPKYIKE